MFFCIRIRARAAVQILLQADDKETDVAGSASTLSGTRRGPRGFNDEKEKRLHRRRRHKGERMALKE